MASMSILYINFGATSIEWQIGGVFINENVVGLPAAPSGLTATAAGLTAVLEWMDNADNETGFKIYAQQDGGGYSILDTVATPNLATYTTPELSAGVWDFYVVAYNAAGNSSNSATASAILIANTPTRTSIINLINFDLAEDFGLF